MAQSITLLGASYPDVPAVVLPKTGGGTATFYEEGELVIIYEVSSTPSASLGKDGDLAIKVVG